MAEDVAMEEEESMAEERERERRAEERRQEETPREEGKERTHRIGVSKKKTHKRAFH